MIENSSPIVVQNQVFLFFITVSVQFSRSRFVHNDGSVLFVSVLLRWFSILVQPIANKLLPEFMTILKPNSDGWNTSVQLPYKVYHNFHPLEVALIVINCFPE